MIFVGPKPRGKGLGQPLQEHSQIVLSYWCPDCDAGPGMRCLTRTGHPKSEAHTARIDMVGRCVRCHQWLMAPPLGEELCVRCQTLVR